MENLHSCKELCFESLSLFPYCCSMIMMLQMFFVCVCELMQSFMLLTGYAIFYGMLCKSQIGIFTCLKFQKVC